MVEKQEEFYQRLFPRLLTDYLAGNPRTILAIRHLLQWLPLENGVKILDIGCGIGWTTFEMARHASNASVTGLDLSVNSINVAKCLFSAPNLSYFSQDVTSTSMPSSVKPVDFITMVDVYEHIAKDKRRSFHDALKGCASESCSIAMTCPTPHSLNFMREHYPERVQPIDEDVTLEDLQTLASDFGGELVYYKLVSIGYTNEYFHAVIHRRVAVEKHETNAQHPLCLKEEEEDLRCQRFWRADLSSLPECKNVFDKFAKYRPLSSWRRLRRSLRIRTRLKAFLFPK